ncbi:hypothetical protein BJ875DRAFT_466190 [Amylocarpus encephaloides]|uniref:Uncharacterized protein n=1 Tax=Amylocarpus encephaloides TaxID=45428 RepID=A0A9P8C3N3_9HELO|nr:hypothetical protein BJ875DRAFT_466190 [Amylocarpus encephaloides]
MSSNNILVERSTCPTGKSWYACSGPNTSKYTGCCSVDACTASGCPDIVSGSSSVSVTTVITLTTIPQPASSTAVAPTSVDIVSGAMVASSTSAVPSETATPAPAPNNTPIIAGITCGIAVASVISVMVCIFWRRKVHKDAARMSSSSFGENDGKDYGMARQNSYYEGSHLQPEDGLGGYKSPLEQPGSLPSESIDLGSRSRSPAIVTVTSEEGNDTEPSTQAHPAYHPLPGRSPEVPAWQAPSAPIAPLTPNTPIPPMHSSHQRAHPAYHVHQLSNHPAFRPGNSPPHPAQPPTWQHPAFRPGSSTQQLDSTPVIPQKELDGFSFSQDKPFKPAPRSLSLANNESELPAKVPRILSPVHTQSDPSLLSRFNQQARSTSPCSQSSSPPSSPKRKYRHTLLTRESSAKTGISTYTIPIGLGVVDGSPTIGRSPFDLPSPVDQDLKPKPLRAVSPPPPMKANMNERDDHVMSWSSYGAGQLSGIGPSNSTGSERSRRQREIEQGIVAREQKSRSKSVVDVESAEETQRWIQDNGIKGKKVWNKKLDLSKGNKMQSYGEGSVPETPLSARLESWMERDSWIRR